MVFSHRNPEKTVDLAVVRAGHSGHRSTPRNFDHRRGRTGGVEDGGCDRNSVASAWSSANAGRQRKPRRRHGGNAAKGSDRERALWHYPAPSYRGRRFLDVRTAIDTKRGTAIAIDTNAAEPAAKAVLAHRRQSHLPAPAGAPACCLIAVVAASCWLPPGRAV